MIVFEGFMKVYIESKDDNDGTEKRCIPSLKVGEVIKLVEANASEVSRPPARYTEASLVKKMEELGIGRPSTYAATITTVQKRGYVEKENREGEERKSKIISLSNFEVKEIENVLVGTEKQKLFPTDIGIVVTDFLIEHFSNVMQYSFTASVENEFDEIAGEKKYGMNDWIFIKIFMRKLKMLLVMSKKLLEKGILVKIQ